MSVFVLAGSSVTVFLGRWAGGGCGVTHFTLEALHKGAWTTRGLLTMGPWALLTRGYSTIGGVIIIIIIIIIKKDWQCEAGKERLAQKEKKYSNEVHLLLQCVLSYS